MEPFIIYFIKVNVALAVLYAFYKLFFSKDTFFRLKRMILVMICVISLLYPFLYFPVQVNWGGNLLEQTIGAVYSRWLPEASVVAGDLSGTEEANPAESMKWLWLVYGVGAGMLCLRTVLELWRIYSSVYRCRRFSYHGIPAYQSSRINEPCSFFKWIFVNPLLHSERELKEILIHEQTHVKELHSLDIVLAQLVIILCWFNPFAWLIRSEIRMNHEYLADKQVIASGCDKKSYQYHLLGIDSTTLAAANLYNNFSVLPLKKRIKMLNRKRTRNIMVSKYLMFIPVTALLIFFSNCANKQEEAKPAAEITEAAPATTPEKKEDSQKVAQPETRTESGEEVFTVVEEMPEFPGGLEALLKYLHNTLKYPAVAENKKEQGRVVVEFVVDKDGSVTDTKIVRGVSQELDEEALRVVREMPKWKPGKQKGEIVRTKYTLPVMFKLPK